MERFCPLQIANPYTVLPLIVISEEEYKIQLEVRDVPIVEFSEIMMLPLEIMSMFPEITLPPEIVRSPVTNIFPGPFIVQLLSVKALCCMRVFSLFMLERLIVWLLMIISFDPLVPQVGPLKVVAL